MMVTFCKNCVSKHDGQMLHLSGGKYSEKTGHTIYSDMKCSICGRIERHYFNPKKMTEILNEGDING